jgi:hypothetical protein
MGTGLFAPIDLYCERTGPEFWSEPVNALTNLVFVAAGLWGVHAARRGHAGGFVEMLGWWVVAIGIGSGLFHTFANRLTIWFDIVPIATLTLVFSFFALRRFAGFARGPATVIFVGFILVAGLITWSVPDWLRIATNGTTGYLPALLAMLVFGALALWRGSPAGWYLLAAGAIFVVAATARMVDPMVCDAFPLGTHFLWHTLNGVMLWVALASAVRYGAAKSAG